MAFRARRAPGSSRCQAGRHRAGRRWRAADRLARRWRCRAARPGRKRCRAAGDRPPCARARRRAVAPANGARLGRRCARRHRTGSARRWRGPTRPGTAAPSGRPTQTATVVGAVEADRPGVPVAVGGAGLVGDAAGRGIVGRRRPEQHIGHLPGGRRLERGGAGAAAGRSAARQTSGSASPPRARPDRAWRGRSVHARRRRGRRRGPVAHRPAARRCSGACACGRGGDWDRPPRAASPPAR